MCSSCEGKGITSITRVIKYTGNREWINKVLENSLTGKTRSLQTKLGSITELCRFEEKEPK